MCGRFTLRAPADSWTQLFLVESDAADSVAEETPRFNIAPTQSICGIIRAKAGEPRVVQHFRWGLVPSWADDLSIGNRMINARAESVDSKPAYRSAFRSRRCLIPADGYLEWKKTAEGKQPYLIERIDGGVFALAGLWELNRKAGTDGQPVRTCTIITTAANPTTAEIHDRMPVLLDADSHEQWLDPAFHEVDALKSFLRPAPDDLLRATPVSRRVNSPRHDDQQCLDPVQA